MVAGAAVVQDETGDGVAEQSLQGAVGDDQPGLVGGDGAVADEFAGVVGAEQDGVGDDDLDVWFAAVPGAVGTIQRRYGLLRTGGST